jgi:hypothetical protein
MGGVNRFPEYRRIELGRISQNQKDVTVSGDFWEGPVRLANRITPPFRKIKCGFGLEIGDGATSGKLLVGVERAKVIWLEVWDFSGRLLSRTEYFHPRPIVLD